MPDRVRDHLSLDLDHYDADDGVALARLVTRLRTLASRHGRVQLHNCPQMLAHTLYKVGLLKSLKTTEQDNEEKNERDRDVNEGHGLEIASVRQDEPYG